MSASLCWKLLLSVAALTAAIAVTYPLDAECRARCEAHPASADASPTADQHCR